MKKIEKELLKVATEACLRAGKVICYYWEGLEKDQISEKSNWKDLVTKADQESEKEIIKVIQKNFQNHKLISEEGKKENQKVNLDTEEEYVWVIDPLDGTTNFIHSYPFFCTSIGIIKNKQPVVAAVYDPIAKEMFTAVKDEGAYLNGVPIEVSKIQNLREALLVTGFSYTTDQSQKKSFDLFQELTLSSHGVRRNGAAALDLCYVACGRIEAFWEYGLKSWDMAAGSLIVEESKGQILDPETQNQFDINSGRILATNFYLKEPLLKRLNSTK